MEIVLVRLTEKSRIALIQLEKKFLHNFEDRNNLLTRIMQEGLLNELKEYEQSL